MDGRYTKASFLQKGSQTRADLGKELAATLLARLRQGTDFHQTVEQLVSELRALGHDLWSFDESDEMEAWGPDYQNPIGPGLIITFTLEDVDVQWSSQATASS